MGRKNYVHRAYAHFPGLLAASIAVALARCRPLRLKRLIRGFPFRWC
jgi:hypothetical protein